MGTYDRRTFLRRAGLIGTAVGLGFAPRPAAAQDDELGPFFHGVASGDPTPDSVVLWTRVTLDDPGESVPLTWEIATDLAFDDVVASGDVAARAATDYTVKVIPDGLEPFAYYYYRFCYGTQPSITGRTKTAPAPGQHVDRLRFGFVSCSNYEGGYFNGYARLAERGDMDAILHAGDYVYEYGQGYYGPGAEIGRVTEPAEEMVTLEQYRGRYAHYHLDPDLRRLHQLYPWITTWDDHESADDSWMGGAVNHQSDEGEWSDRLAAAWKSYREWLPINVDASSMDEPIVLYRSFSYGDLADLIVMDTRIEGRDQQVYGALEPGLFETEIDNPDRRLISPAQQTFVESALSQSRSAWRIILQQVMMMQWNVPGLPEIDLAELAGADVPQIITAGGMSLNGDAWDGYRAERSRLFAHLRSNEITDVVVLTGDIHTTWAAELTEHPFNVALLDYDPLGVNPLVPRNLGVEFVTPSITSDNIDEILASTGLPADLATQLSVVLETGILATNLHIKSVDLTQHGYGIIDVNGDRVTYDTFFTPTRAPSSNEVFHQSWYVERSAATPGLTAADRGHKLIRGSGPTASRVDVAAVPDPLPVAKTLASAPTTALPSGPAEGLVDLPRTGTSVPLTAAAVAAAAAIAMRTRSRVRPSSE